MNNIKGYNPFFAAGQAAIAELTSSDAQLFYVSVTLNTVDATIKETLIIGEFVQTAVGLVIFLAGESFESGQVFRQQIHEGYMASRTLEDATQQPVLLPSVEPEVIDADIIAPIQCLPASPVRLVLPMAIATQSLRPAINDYNCLPEVTSVQIVSRAETWKCYVEAILGLKAWSKVLEANLTCKQLRAELGDRGIQPAPKTRKSQLAIILAQGKV